MDLQDSITETIGNTPLVKLNKITTQSKATIALKLEYFNPGGSIKDRVAVAMINAAEKEGSLRPGGTIVEATSGNTGFAIAMISAARGYKAIIICTDSVCHEKIAALKAFGAYAITVPAGLPLDSPEHYLNKAKRIVSETKNAIFANQFFNPENPQAHYLTTGPEIWQQTDGRVTTFVAGAATGGTISGTGRYLKEKNPNIEVVMADPHGSIYKEYFETGKIENPSPYLVEAVGQDSLFIPDTIDFSIIDRVITINDEESFLMARRLACEEGIFCGMSSGLIMSGAIQVAQEKGRDDLIVALAPDAGDKYLSRLYSNEWLNQNMPKLNI
jgi:cystathionine beta-synthase